MHLQKLFASRIGGEEYGKVSRVFKFTLIENAKREFLQTNPGAKLIDMGVGEPEERASDRIIETLYHEAKKVENRIYPNNGILEFKLAAAGYLKKLIDLEFNPETEIVHCIGTKTGLAQLPFVFINPNDSVMVTVPGYPVLPTLVNWLSGKTLALKLTQGNKYLPDLGEIEEYCRKHAPKLLLLNYPNNPTGAIATLEFYKQVVALAHKYNFVIVQDAAYADYCFAGKFCSPFQVDGGKDVSMELYSLSKSYNMQGYRLGFVVSNPLLLSAFALVKDNMDNGQFIAIQKSGIEALQSGFELIQYNREKYRGRLERTCQILNECGLEAQMSSGSFYLYFRVPQQFHGVSFDSAESFSKFLITKLGIVSVPWDDAGAYVRLSMTFEIGNNFADVDAVFNTFKQRLQTGKL